MIPPLLAKSEHNLSASANQQARTTVREKSTGQAGRLKLKPRSTCTRPRPEHRPVTTALQSQWQARLLKHSGATDKIQAAPRRVATPTRREARFSNALTQTRP